LNTWIGTGPDAAMSPAGIVAWRTPAACSVVARSEPFHRTTDDEMNPVPFTVRVKPGPPATVPVGFSEVITGAGLPVSLVAWRRSVHSAVFL
jgi:hypothetical protein